MPESAWAGPTAVSDWEGQPVAWLSGYVSGPPRSVFRWQPRRVLGCATQNAGRRATSKKQLTNKPEAPYLQGQIPGFGATGRQTGHALTLCLSSQHRRRCFDHQVGMQTDAIGAVLFDELP
ncbi:hypothetical protein GCM10027578_36000 [Spirosoma luteolum]